MVNDKVFDQKYAKYYDLFNKNKDYSKECDFLEKVFEKYFPGKVKKILDLGCGTGIHAQNLSKIGYGMDGLDLSQAMLNIADSRNIPGAKFYLGDMSQFNINQRYDVCTSMFAAFGYLTKNKQIESALKSIKGHLNPGGLFILDVWNGLGVMHELPTSRVKISSPGDYKITRTSYPCLDAKNHICKVKFDVKIQEDNEEIDFYEETHNMRFFFPQELKKYFQDSGFEILEICKMFQLGTEVNENDWNMSIISRLKE